MITDWEWDYDEFLDEETGFLTLPFTSEEFANYLNEEEYYNEILKMLPGAILVDGETLALGTWTYEPGEAGATVSIGSESYLSAGVFKTTLPEGYVLADGGNTLRLPVTVAPIDPSEGPNWESYGDAPETYMGVRLEEPTTYTYYYRIETIGHLYWFAWYVNQGNTTANAYLCKDITVNQNINADPSTLIPWEPIADYQGRFVGYTIGTSSSDIYETHTISGLYCDKNLIAGLFSSLSGNTAEIRNICIKNSYFKSATGGGAVGAICAMQNGGTITYCTNEDSTCVTGSEMGAVGGIVGTMNAGKISNCTNNTNLYSNSSKGTGGICGCADAGEITNCENKGTIQAEGYVGGICGLNKAQIHACESTGAISGTDYVGGIAGFSTKSSGQNINRGSVTATGNYAGGICGYLDYNPSLEQNYGDVTGANYIGGLYGDCTGRIEACANYGRVQSTGANIGALAGNVGVNMKDCLSYNAQNMSLPLAGNSIQITNSYYLAASDSAASTSGTPRTAEQFQSGQVTYLLNQGSKKVWGQQLGTDAYPILDSGATVYKYTSNPCPEEFYSNTSGETRTLEHDMSGGSPYCKRCGYGGQKAVWKKKDGVSNYDGQTLYDRYDYYTDSSYTTKLENCEFIWAKLTTVDEGTYVYTRKDDLPRGVGSYYGAIILQSNNVQYKVEIGSGNTLDIGPKTISVSWDVFDATYDKQVHLPTYKLSGVVAGEDVRLQTQIVDGYNFIDAGTQKYKYTGTLLGKDAGNYKINGSQNSFTIKKKTINSVTLKPKASYPFGEVKTYDWTPDWESPDVFDGDAPFSFGLEQLKSDDSWGSPTNPWNSQYNAGQYAVYVSGINSKNYELAEGVTGRAEFTITPLELVTPESLPSSVYTGRNQYPTLPKEYASTVSSPSVSFKDVGEHEVQLNTRVNNYVWDSNGGKTKFTITPKDLAEEDVTLELLNASNLVYDGTEKKPTVKLSYGSDTLSSSDANCGFTVAYEDNIEGGEAKAIVTATQGGNYTGTRTLTFTIGQADNEWVTDPTVKVPFIYGDTNPVTYSAKYGNANVVVTHKKQGSQEAASTGIPTDVGTYDVTVSLAETSSYKVLAPVNLTLTISPKSLSEDDIAIQATNPTYTGTPQSPEVVVKYGEITLEKGKDYTLSGTGTDAGDYPFTVTLTGNYTGSKAQTFSIEKADSECTAPAVNDLTYTGQAQALVSAGSTTHGTLVYSLTQDGTYEAALPTGTDAGSYTVWYKIVGDDNHKDSAPASVSCSIAKESLTVTAKDKTITYGEAPGNSGVTYDGFVNGESKADLKGELTYTYSYKQFDNVGTGEFKITPGGLTSGNYAITFAPGTLTVTKKTIGITWSNTSLPYNGTAQAPTATATDLEGNDECNITVTGQMTKAGNYTATAASLSNSNYQLPESKTCDFSITKIPPVLTAPTGKTVLYTGNALELAEAGTAQGGTMMYRLDENSQWGDAVPKATDCGTYTVWYKVMGDQNHNDTEALSLTAEIVPFLIPLQPQPQPQDINYGTSTELSVGLETNVTEGISYQWCLVTEEDGREVYTPLEGETGSKLALTKPNAGKYVYACVITCGDYSETSGKATVTVTAVQESLPTTTDLPSGLWVEGGEEPLTGSTIDLKTPSSFLMTSYTYNGASADAHQNYPTGMQIYSVQKDDQGNTAVAPVAELGNLLRYSGCSIRITGKPGIRMITSLTKEAKEALKKGELAGYTLEEYGTVVAWTTELGSQPLTLSTGKSSYAYKRGVSDPVFANVGALTQYTNVLVWDSLEDQKYDEDIVMRPYIKLINKEGQTVVLYGGTVSRSIGYVAQQNANTFSKGTAGYKYVHEIIGKVNALHSSTGTNTTTGGNG